jgi:hypothetical protein
MIDPNEDFEQPIPEPEPGKTAGIGNPRRPARRRYCPES